MSVVVKVNGQEISDSMLEASVARYFVQLEDDETVDFNPTPENMKYIRTESLNYLIERVLFLQLAQKKGIEIDEKEVERRIRLLRSEYENEEEWKANLLALSVKEEDLFQEIHDDLMIENLLEVLYSENIDMDEKALKQFYEENEARMKEPDLFTFYEVGVENVEQVQTAAITINSKIDIDEKEKRLNALGMQFVHHIDIPFTSLPEQVINVLNDLEPGKIGTMILDDQSLVVFQLLKRKIGKKYPFEDIKEHLGQYLKEQGRKETYSLVKNREMDKAEIEYVDLSTIQKK